MKKIISTCPCCHGALHISTLQCSNCGMELKNDFGFSPFDQLSTEQYHFLIAFLRNRGNLKEVQNELQLSYPTAKKRLNELLTALNLCDAKEEEHMEIDLRNLEADRCSPKASELIKAKLIDHGGHVTVSTARGLPCEIYAAADGVSFTSEKLPLPLEYAVFDVIVELLKKQGGRAKKGNGRNYKLGEPGCEETTVVGAVALYCGRKMGESVFDPVFVLAAILEWAGIAENGRGELILTQEYITKSQSSLLDRAALEAKFEAELRNKAQQAIQELNYTPRYFLNMIHQHGGVETAKHLILSGIRSGHPSEGFLKFCQHNRIDLSMENSVCQPEYASLFSEEEIEYCKNLIETE